jgi:hypothetical protein
MRYQLRLPKSVHPDELSDELALAAWGGIIAASGPEGPPVASYPHVARAVRELMRANLRPLDACGMMCACTDGAQPVLAGGHAADKSEAIWGMELAEGADGLVRDLAEVAAAAAALPASAQGGIRARIARGLQSTLYRNDLCGRPQCERSAEPKSVGAAGRLRMAAPARA